MSELHESIERLTNLITTYTAYNGTEYNGPEYARQTRIELEAFCEVLQGIPHNEERFSHTDDRYRYRAARATAEGLAGTREERESNP